MAKVLGPPKDPRVTSEGIWKPTDDCLLPNPPLDAEHGEDKVFDEEIKEKKHDTKVIMAHEFRENPEGFKTVAQKVADSYNEANCLEVGGELPDVLEKKEKDD